MRRLIIRPSTKLLILMRKSSRTSLAQKLTHGIPATMAASTLLYMLYYISDLYANMQSLVEMYDNEDKVTVIRAFNDSSIASFGSTHRSFESSQLSSPRSSSISSSSSSKTSFFWKPRFDQWTISWYRYATTGNISWMQRLQGYAAYKWNNLCQVMRWIETFFRGFG